VETTCGGEGEKASKAVQGKGFAARCGVAAVWVRKKLFGGKLP
jgi:hypothetical protein